MIWLFRVKHLHWGETEKVNEYYLFDVDDINFDLTEYDVSLYFPSSNYYLMNDVDSEKVYVLLFDGLKRNQLSNKDKAYGIVKDFYSKEKRITNIKKILGTQNDDKAI